QRSGDSTRAPKEKAPDVSARGFVFRCGVRSARASDHLDLIGLHALLALHGDERHALAFLKRLEAGALDRAEVHEKVRAALGGDEAKALGIVEPFDGSGLTIRHLDISFVYVITNVIAVRRSGPRLGLLGVNEAKR